MIGGINITCVWQAGAILGEGPIWSQDHNGLFWVDIKKPALHLFRPDTDERLSWPLPKMIGCVAPSPDGTLIAALEDGVYRFSLPTPGSTPDFALIAAPHPHPSHMRFNDGKYAPDGSLWAGTMDNREEEAEGAWYRLDQAGSLSRLAGGFMVTNGPAFDSTRNRVYLNDSAPQITYMAAMDAESDLELSVFRQFGPADGYPDGMAAGPDGLVWIAFWDGGCLRALDPDTGETRHTVKMPVPRPTSCAFGGPDGATLYVTSASIGLDDPEMKSSPLSGGLFAITGLFGI